MGTGFESRETGAIHGSSVHGSKDTGLTASRTIQGSRSNDGENQPTALLPIARWDWPSVASLHFDSRIRPLGQARIPPGLTPTGQSTHRQPVSVRAEASRSIATGAVVPAGSISESQIMAGCRAREGPRTVVLFTATSITGSRGHSPDRARCIYRGVPDLSDDA